jgi:hypothetical protein
MKIVTVDDAENFKKTECFLRLASASSGSQLKGWPLNQWFQYL